MDIIHSATDDYISSRCILLNGLFPGLSIGAQSIEKFLKAFLFLNDYEQKKVRNFNHNLIDLAKEVESISNFKFLKYKEILSRLQQHYNSRYPDNEVTIKIKSTAELVNIDEITLFLYSLLPLPDEIKFSTGIYARIFKCEEGNCIISNTNESLWLTKNNSFLDRNKLNELLIEYKIVMESIVKITV